MALGITALVVLIVFITYCLILVNNMNNEPTVRDKTCEDCRFSCKTIDNETCERFKD